MKVSIFEFTNIHFVAIYRMEITAKLFDEFENRRVFNGF